eukprot:1140640-Pelagomonas_calceolata.AAC.4
MPMVGMPTDLVMAAAMGPGTHSSTSAKQPARCSACAWSRTCSASSATCAWGRKPPVLTRSQRQKCDQNCRGKRVSKIPEAIMRAGT